MINSNAFGARTAFARFAEDMSHLADRAKNWDKAKALTAAAQRHMADDVRRCFTLQRTPWGDPWTPIKHRNKHGTPLIDTGAMMRAALAAASGAVYTNDHQIYLKTDEPKYLHFQNDGTSTIPARPFLGLSNESYEAMDREVFEDFQKHLFGDSR